MDVKTKLAYETWARTYDTDPNPHIFLEHEYVLQSVDARTGDKILDAACGTGKYTVEFHRSGAHVTGLDFSPGMLAVARTKDSSIEWITADLTQRLPFADAVFDKINCSQALKHIKDLEPTLREFYRALKTSGKLFFSVGHPQMNYEGYELLNPMPEIAYLSRSSNKYEHSIADFQRTIETVGLTCERLIEIPVNEKIRHFLTEASFSIVRGRKQIALFCCKKL